MAAILKIPTTLYELPDVCRRLKEAGYMKVKLDLEGSYGHLTVLAWGGDLKKYKNLLRKRVE